MRDSQAKLVLFSELRRGPLTEVEASLFPVRMREDMIREGIIKRLPDGGIELVHATGYSRTAPSDRPTPVPPESLAPPPGLMPTITARVPQEVLDYLDSLGCESRGAAVRLVFARVLSARSGTRKASGQ